MNFHQWKLNKRPFAPVNLRYKSWTPFAPVTLQVADDQVCHPPVLDTAHVPTTEPVKASRWSSMFPPLPPEATRASKDVAPLPKSTPFTLM